MSPKRVNKFVLQPPPMSGGDEHLFSSPVRNRYASPRLHHYRTPSTSSSRNYFLVGSEPSKVDRDVIIAIGDTVLNPMLYPLTRAWKKCVESFSKEDQSRWRTPRRKLEKRPILPMSPIAF